MTEHPITPSDELFGEWIDTDEGGPSVISRIATRAAQWGADQELEACCEWLASRDLRTQSVAPCLLRAARRPKPPSLKKQALADFDWLVGRTLGRPEFDERSERIRRALEQLDD